MRKPVFRSWDVLPPFATATAITHAIEMARTRSSIWVQPRSRKIREIAIKEAIVMPEIGLAELPICPQMREDTVVKKNPNAMMRAAPSRFTPICGRKATTTARASDPNTVRVIGRSSSVRSRWLTAWPRRLAFRSAKLAWNELTMVGRARARAIIPAVATAPAPM